MLSFSGARAADLAFVINSGSASISLLDVTTARELRRVPLLREPHHMALSPDHSELLVGDTAGNAMFFLDPRTGAVRRRMAMSDPYQFAFSPDGRYLTVAGLARNQIDIYDARSYALLHRVAAPSMPSHMNYTPDGSIVFVSLQGSDSLAAIETATGRELWVRRVGRTPAGVLWFGGQLLVGIMGEAHVAIVDPVDGDVVATIPTGRGAHTMFVSHDGQTLYETNRVEGTICVLDVPGRRVVRTIAVPGGPDDLEFAPDGRIWASLRFAHAVGIIDPASGAVRRVQVGRSPHGIWLNTHDGFGNK